MSLRGLLVRWRYALPGRLGPLLPAPSGVWAVRLAQRLHRRGIGATIGYFQGDEAPEQIAAVLAGVAANLPPDAHIAVKAPPLRFDPGAVATIGATGRTMVFDAHSPADVDATHAMLTPGAGVVLPARWRRSLGDAQRLRDAPVRVRLVKGEWADPEGDPEDIAAAYLDLVRALAGRQAPVGIATHDPALAERALDLLLSAGTPCELEQLRGLPRRRTMALARARRVAVRFYIPFGPGWWSYAIDKALARPYLPLWLAQDLLGYRRGS